MVKVMVKDIAKLGVSDLRPPLTPSAYRDTILAQTKSQSCVANAFLPK